MTRGPCKPRTHRGGEIKAQIMRLADGTRTAKEIAALVGTNRNYVLKLAGELDLPLKHGLRGTAAVVEERNALRARVAELEAKLAAIS